MTIGTRLKLLGAWQYCDENDKSTEFMLQYMQDLGGVDLDCVLDFIQNTPASHREAFTKRKYFKTENK